MTLVSTNIFFINLTIMKKSLLTLAATWIAMSAMAVANEQMQMTSLHELPNLSEVKPLESLTVGLPSPKHKVSARLNHAEDVITAPEGTIQDVTIKGSGYYLFSGYMLATYVNDAFPSNVIYGADNEVYISDILPHTNFDTYTKGILKDNTVTISLPQTLYYDAEQKNGYNLTMLTYDEWQMVDEETGELVFDENGDPVMEGTYCEDEEPAAVTFNIDADGKWTLSSLPDKKLLGLTLCSGEGWGGYGVVELSIIPFTEKPVAVPDDIEISKDFWSYIPGDYGWFVNFAQVYDELYFQGICSEFPEAWIKANIEYIDDTIATVSLPQNQYLGIYGETFYIYTKCATYDDDNNTWNIMPDDYQYELVWNMEDNTLKAKDHDVYFLFNGALDHIYYVELFQDLSLLHQNSLEGTPADPNNLIFKDTIDDYGYNGFFFNVPSISTDGNLLKTEDLYYVIYVDGEEWECNADEYLLPESLTEIPWNYSEYYIYNYGGASREVDFFVEGLSTVGVQTIYRYNGEETRSEIITLDLEGGSAVKAVGADKEVAKVMYFDLAGRAVANPANGLYIKRTTYTDGTTVSSKKFVR